MSRPRRAKHPEYQRAKAELGWQLGLRPGDVHPLDIDLDHDGPIDARTERAHLSQLSVAYRDWLYPWAPPRLRAVSEEQR
jgi:hypothetical protein